MVGAIYFQTKDLSLSISYVKDQAKTIIPPNIPATMFSTNVLHSLKFIFCCWFFHNYFNTPCYKNPSIILLFNITEFNLTTKKSFSLPNKIII